jgi:invasion protein IalB
MKNDQFIKLFIKLFLITTFSAFNLNPDDENKYYDGNNWIYSCEGANDDKIPPEKISVQEYEDREKDKICFLSQTLSSSSDQSVKLQIRLVPTYEDNINLILITHLGVDLTKGTALIDKDNNIFAEGSYVTCLSFGCVSVSTLKKHDLNIILNAKDDKIYVALFNTDNVSSLKNIQARHIVNVKGAKEWLKEISQ